MGTSYEEAALKKGTAELLVLAQLEHRRCHGYEIALQIAARSDGAVSFHAASLYPILYRLEKRGLIEGRWVEKAGERRRRFYRITAPGREVLRRQRSFWKEFIRALDRVAAITHP